MKDYSIGTDGVKVKLDSPCLSGWVTPASLDELQTYATKEIDKDRCPDPVWTGSKFPAALMQQVIGTIHEFPRMETAYSLYYNPTSREWAVKCPEQNGSGASVRYADDGSGMPEGFSIIGSIHTHPEMGAFWSGTDLNDQQKKHGIHFVFGLRNGFVTTSKVTVFTPIEQFDQNLRDVVEDFDWAQVYPAVDEWVETIKKQSYHPPVTIARYYGGYYSHRKPVSNSHYGHVSRSYTYYDDYMSGRSSSCWDDYDYDYSGYDSYDYSGYGYTYKPPKHTQQPKAKTELEIEAGVTGSTASAQALLTTDVTADNKYFEVIWGALDSVVEIGKFRDAIIDCTNRAAIEQECDVVIIDALDKTDIIAGIEEIMALVPNIEKFDEEEQNQIVDSVFSVFPDAQLVDELSNGMTNGPGVDTLISLIEGAAEAYRSQPKCLDEPDVNSLLTVLKSAYESILETQAGETEEEAAQC